MSNTAKFYLTTPIYYINDQPHIGHAYTTIVADVLARYHRLKGEEVFFLTGTDENSQKNLEASRRDGERDLKKYLDKMSARWQETWDSLNITYNDFIRTTEKRHLLAVKKFFMKAYRRGDIYKGVYEGFYCVGCESFITENDLIDGRCPFHKKIPQRLKEKNYFFRLANYRRALLKYFDEHPEFVQPEKRRNEIISYIKDFMTDLSISRQNMSCGIPLPISRQQAIYVWFDALINYLTAIGYHEKSAQRKNSTFKKWWPADVHIIGKDILKFHAAIWPGMLMSAGLPLPKKLFVHGFFTVNGEKMSKTLGNVIDPVELTKIYSNDALRWFLLSEIKFGEDGDFSLVRLKQVYETKLANELGNLVYRVLSMTEKYFQGLTPKFGPASEGLDPLCEIDVWRDYEKAMDNCCFEEAIALISRVIAGANQLIDKEKPWELSKNPLSNRLADVLYNLLETLRQLGWLLLPIMPETSEKIWRQLGLEIAEEKAKSLAEARIWGGLKPGTKIQKGETLFPKISL